MGNWKFRDFSPSQSESRIDFKESFIEDPIPYLADSAFFRASLGCIMMTYQSKPCSIPYAHLLASWSVASIEKHGSVLLNPLYTLEFP